MNLIETKTNNYSILIQLAEELLRDGYFLQIKVGGYSMFPYLRKGDTVFMKKESFNTLKIGDIIVFRSGIKLIAHRIIALKKTKSQTKIITKGDSLISIDKPINNENYIGKITAFRRKNKTITLDTQKKVLLNKVIVIFSIVSIPFFLILIPLTIFFHFFKTQLVIYKNKVSD